MGQLSPGFATAFGSAFDKGDRLRKPTYEQLVEMLEANLVAWEGEEDSVREEHMILIVETSAILERVAKGT